MKRLLLSALLLGLAACAVPTPNPGRPVALLQAEPERPHEVIGKVEARGTPGDNLRRVHEQLRDKARALGADAVVEVEVRQHFDATPAPYDAPQLPLPGNAYPGPLHSFEPGAFPPAGFDVRARGSYYVIEGLAILFLDDPA
jgi:hypothetical protein